MRWLNTEYALKGIYLGLVGYAAMQEARSPGAAWTALAWVNGLTLAGLVIALVVAAIVKKRQGYSARGARVAYLLFLMLECPEP
jgi:uncharacterized membrane protein